MQFVLDRPGSGLAPNNHVFRSIYDSLTVLLPDQSIGPRLARSWKIGADQTVYTLALRGDVMFDDGTRFNAAAVKVNLDRIADPKNVPLCPAAPMLAALQFARPDQLTGGRIALHLITGDSDKKLWTSGSDIGEDECDQRTKEYLGVAYQKRTRLLRRASLFMSKPIGGAMSGQ